VADYYRRESPRLFLSTLTVSSKLYVPLLTRFAVTTALAAPPLQALPKDSAPAEQADGIPAEA